mmetsp:Transcript_8569/g.22103  ORF Transcript_8569/g.22103 Transcript_8569/m.22103 type:complete len:207 (+) Transcript_8569:149-769(+)
MKGRKSTGEEWASNLNGPWPSQSWADARADPRSPSSVDSSVPARVLRIRLNSASSLVWITSGFEALKKRSCLLHTTSSGRPSSSHIASYSSSATSLSCSAKLTESTTKTACLQPAARESSACRRTRGCPGMSTIGIVVPSAPAPPPSAPYCSRQSALCGMIDVTVPLRGGSPEHRSENSVVLPEPSGPISSTVSRGTVASPIPPRK